MFYNSRSNSETVDGLFYMFPKDKELDANGKDLNDYANSSSYVLFTRLGLDLNGPMLGKAKTSAKIEVDFRGTGTSYSAIRLRHAYVNLDWGQSALLVGQTWHPLCGDILPEVLNLNTGAPYQPFGRAPQIRYRFSKNHFLLTASALWQSQYLSVGPKSNAVGETGTQKSMEFLKRGCIPEFFLGMDYRSSAWMAGAGVHVGSIVPRTESEKDGKRYRVSERITGVSAEAHLKYKKDDWMVAAKTVLGTNLTQTSSVGGYGIVKADNVTGEQEYAPLRTSSSWVNVAYGKKWRPALFFGYLKNLGATKDVTGVLGTGTSIDELFTGTAELTYNVPHWKIGAEYSICNAWYGDEFNAKHKATHSHGIENHRVLMSVLYQF